MNINLIAVGKRMPAWVDACFSEYKKRLSREIILNLIEVDPAQRNKKYSTQDVIRKELKKIQSAIPKNNMVIALDENGSLLTSNKLSKKINDYMKQSRDISLIIGGADGLDDDFKNSCHEVWSLSRLTLPHAMARILVAEQIYRAWSIIMNHPYHRD